jgi:hypothetical protein
MCSSIPPDTSPPSKREAVGSTMIIKRVPQRPHNSCPSSLGAMQRWQKIFEWRFAIHTNEGDCRARPRLRPRARAGPT